MENANDSINIDELNISLDELLDNGSCSFLTNGQRTKVKLVMITAIRKALEEASKTAITEWENGCSNSDCDMSDVYNHVDSSILKTLNRLK